MVSILNVNVAFKLILLCFISWISLGVIQANAQVNKIISAQVLGKNQLMLGLTDTAKFHYFTLSAPDRFVVDFDQTALTIPLNHISLDTLPVQSIRSSLSANNTLRLVFDLTSAQRPQLHSLPASAGQPARVMIVFDNAPNVQKIQNVIPKSPLPPKSITKPKPHIITVIIDPGHGGKDPGAHGRYGTLEKNVVLSIAKQLQSLINRQPGMRAVLTRQGDYFVNLRQRLSIARKNSGDVFVSIHADAFQNPYSHGVSVFALSERGGTSEAAKWLAEKENYSELGGVSLGDLDDKNGMIRSVLIDLSETATIGASLELGDGVLNHIGHVTHLHHHDVEQAQFVVLKSLDIPSVLVETGFISNPQEEMQLKNPAYQAKIAQAILLGIQQYLRQHPPRQV